MAQRPIVNDLYTRRLETRDVVRTFVKHAEVVEHDAQHVCLRTVAAASTRPFGAGRVDVSGAPGEGELIDGSIRVDVLTDTIIRVRYCQGDAIPENDTPMVVGKFSGPADSRSEISDQGVTLHTAEVTIDIGLRPFSLIVRSTEGRLLCEIGGYEKNFFGGWDTYNTGICYAAPDGQPLAVECFSLRPQEAIYGFGEQFIGLDKRGQTIDLNMVEASGVTTPRSYKNIPFFVSTSGYGVFFNTSARMTAWVGSRAATDVQVAIEDDFLDYYVILGDIKQVLSRYTDITGKGQLPPPWSFGYWQSKISYGSADEALGVVRNLRAADVPVDVIHVDTNWFREDWRCDLEFDPDRFPDPKRFTEELAEMGVKLSLWQLPYIPQGSALFDELLAADGFVKRADGNIYDVGICYTPGFRGVVGCIDFTNPEGLRVYQEYLRRLFELGVRVIKVDFGEQAPLDGVYHDGTPGHRMHNLYPLLYNKAVADVTVESTGEHIIWARSAWAGSQRYPLHWGGDSSANWHNIAPQLAGGLSLGLSGFQFWSQDIGGFLGQPNGELLIRWFQASMFISHCRMHGTGMRGLNEFGGEVLRICREFLQLRYRLMPYLLATAVDCVKRSLPMMRPLVIEFQDDPATWGVADQWLLGDAVLVAPVMDASSQRRVYLPAGATWTDWWTDATTEGGQWIHLDVPIDRMPIFLREGAVIPLGPVTNYVGEVATDAVTVRVAPFQGDGSTTLHVPLGDGYRQIEYTARSGTHRLRSTPGVAALSLDVSGTTLVELIQN